MTLAEQVFSGVAELNYGGLFNFELSNDVEERKPLSNGPLL